MRIVLRIGVALFVIAAAYVALLHRGTAGQIHVTTEIAATRDQVWPFLDKRDLAKQWMRGVNPPNPAVSPATEAIGVTEVWEFADEFWHDGDIFSVLALRVTRAESRKPERLSAHISMPREFEGEWTYELVEMSPARTRLEMTARLRYIGASKYLEPFITWTARRRIESDAARLKEFLEHRGAGYSAGSRL